MSKRARDLIQTTHPHLSARLDQVGTLKLVKRRDYSIPEAVSRTVISQMLSASAAATIRGRATQLAADKGLNGIADLCYEDLRGCGLSNAKARTITEFSAAYRAQPSRYEAWRTLPSDLLFSEVKQCWGLSNWSASILGIFYFGNADIFPVGDGSIARATKLLEATVTAKKRKNVIDAELCRPYRSYLALYLWRMLDDGLLVNEAKADLEKEQRVGRQRRS